MSVLRFALSDLPKIVEIVGNKGEKKLYKLSRSKKHLGASLQSVDMKVQSELIKSSNQSN